MFDTHNQWKKWKVELDKNMKYDVCLYEMKYVHEKELNDVKDMDFLFNYIYSYNGKIMGDDGERKNIQDDLAFPLEKTKNDIITKLTENGRIRVGFFNKNVYNNKKNFYLLSSNHYEDSKYYVKCVDYPSEDVESVLYYTIRYDMDESYFYAISSISPNTLGIPEEKIAPRNMDELDNLRFHLEYFEQFNVGSIYEKLKNMDEKDYFNFAFESGLSFRAVKAIGFFLKK